MRYFETSNASRPYEVRLPDGRKAVVEFAPIYQHAGRWIGCLETKDVDLADYLASDQFRYAREIDSAAYEELKKKTFSSLNSAASSQTFRSSVSAAPVANSNSGPPKAPAPNAVPAKADDAVRVAILPGAKAIPPVAKAKSKAAKGSGGA